jgi:hypothetical protein
VDSFVDICLSWIVTAWVPGITSANTPDAKPDAFWRTMFVDRIYRIHRTRWMEATVTIFKEYLEPAVVW